MKKFFLFTLIAIALFSGCRKEEKEPVSEPKFTDLIIGKWINTHVDGQPILTDESFTMQLKSNNVQVYAQGFIIDDNNKQWKESENYRYSVSDRTITIDGTSPDGASTHLVFVVTDISQNSMTYKVQELKLAGINIDDSHTYTLQRVTANYNNNIIGFWKGRETTPEANPEYDNYWEYFSDGSYNYYYYDSTTHQYICKVDNNGRYFLYGDFVAFNFTNFYELGLEGLYYECWNIGFEGDSMFWTGFREGGITKNFAMKKVDNPFNHQEEILGTWINTKINDVTIFTNNAYVLRFDNTNIIMYAKGYQKDVNKSYWAESENFVYSIENNIITIDGIDALGVESHREFVIQSISQNLLTYTVQKMEIDGVLITDNNTYLMERSIDNSLSIIGVWKGRETTPGVNPSYDVYLKFFDNGDYYYYYRNEETGNYEVMDNGRYFLYGNLLVHNYIPSASNSKYECWNITLSDHSLNSSSLQIDGILKSFSFERTENPPM